MLNLRLILFLKVCTTVPLYELYLRDLCEIAGVSRDGYYNYLSNESQHRRNTRILKDEESRNNIQKTFDFKNYQKGARQIKMVLENQFNIIYNLKRIRRIMKKFDIVCTIRKANPHKKMMKATKLQ